MNGSGSGRKILDTVSDRIAALATGRNILAALAGFLVLAWFVNGRPFGSAELMAITGGVGLLDMQVLYTPDQAYAHLAAMGDAGRAFDLTRIVPIDMLVPLFYALSLSLLITWVLHRWLPAKSPYHRLNVVPVIGGICDYLENIGIIVMLLAWPQQLSDIARFTMAATVFKFAFSALAFAILFAALAGWAVSGMRNRWRSSPA